MNRPIHCGKPMMKAGHTWSGHHKIQRWKCNICGATTTVKGKTE